MILWVRHWWWWWRTPTEEFLSPRWLHEWRQQDRDHI
jgi:hypothetical protein